MLFGIFCMVFVAGCTALLADHVEPLINEIFSSDDKKSLYLAAGGVFLLMLIRGLADYGESVAMGYVGDRIVTNFQRRLFNHLVGVDLKFYQKTPIGQLVARLTNDVEVIGDIITETVTSICKDSLMVIFLVIVMYMKDPLLAFLATVIFPIAILPIAKIGRRMRHTSTDLQDTIAEFTSLLTQAFQGARLIKAYGMEKYERTKAKDIVDRLFTHNFGVTKFGSISHPIMDVLAGLVIAIVVIYGGNQIMSGDQTPGGMMAFITALLFAYEPMKRLARLNSKLQEGLASAARVFDLIDLEIEAVGDDFDTPLKVTKGKISFKKVTFSYDGKQDVLDDLTVDIAAGKTTALVGPSGSGKSTLMNLIPRFYEITQGQLLIDEQDIQKVSLTSLRDNIALVSQDVILFNDTVRANIAFGDPKANLEEIYDAAKAAAAYDFIQELPDGFDTVVGERGTRLSGGQKQRIAIARAMLRKAPLLLLDEVTSALDAESEQKVQQALNTLKKGKTTLIIAHRLSTVMGADSIYFLDEGKVVAKGTHKELINAYPPYKALCEAQFTKPHDS